VVVAAGSFLLVRWLRAPTDEERIERVIAEAERGIETQDLAVVMKGFSSEYLDSDGNGYLQLRALAHAYVTSSPPMTVHRRNTEIRVHNGEATVDITGTVKQGRGTLALVEALPGHGDLVRVVLQMRRERGDWKIVAFRFADLKFN